MKKIVLTTMGLLIIGSIYAQVGVNTENPSTTFHVVPTRTDNSTAEGFIAPNLKRAEVIGKDARYGTPQTGTMVYVTDLSGTVTAKTANITTTGYYYFDGTKWQAFISGTPTVNITADNGLSMSGTTVKLGGALTAATSITGASILTLATPIQISSGTPGAGKVLTSDASGNAAWATLPNPWYKVGTAVSSTLNTDDSFLTAKAVIGGNSIASINGGSANAQLTVTGGDASINGITVGRGAGSFSSNTAIGSSTLQKNTTGDYNTAIGTASMPANTTGGYNTALGRSALLVNTTGGNNTIVGYTAGADMNGGGYNTFIGSTAGNGMTAGDYNIMIGYNTTIAGTASNQLNIGNAIYGVTTTSGGTFGRVSIGKKAPDVGVYLDVVGLTQITGANKFRYVDGNQATGKVLASDASGNAAWTDPNMLSGTWFYLPSINLDMSSTSAKSVDLFTTGVTQLLSSGTLIASSSGAVRPTLPATATAYDYFVVGSSGHITSVSITTSGVMTYTPTTNNPPPFAYVNIIVRVK